MKNSGCKATVADLVQGRFGLVERDAGSMEFRKLEAVVKEAQRRATFGSCGWGLGRVRQPVRAPVAGL
jgi:hypothetical protein